jgi:biopolymer transport protein ExbD
MKFPRNVKILRSHFDMAPFAAVFFLLVIFLMLTTMTPAPGLPLRPPDAGDLPAMAKPSVAVALDANGRFYFANRILRDENELKADLQEAVKVSPAPLTLVIHADKSVTYDQLVRLTLLARGPGIGITNLLLATLPRVGNPPPSRE